jgi:hypothetical protein
MLLTNRFRVIYDEPIRASGLFWSKYYIFGERGVQKW